MALNINGYNTDFNAFVKFAQNSFVTNDKTAVARFLSDATGVDEFTAIEQLSTPGSKANRLMNYGGRFMDSATSFANGLRLMDSFKDWYTNIFDTMKPVHKQERNVRDFSPADTFTKLNIDGNFIDMDYLQGFEKFAFEELAANPKANLAETDMEKLFGFKDNKAMAFIGTGYGNSFYSTIANVPKEKRAIIYTALNAFTVPAKNAQEAHNKNMGNRSYTKLNSNHAPAVIARLVKNFDKAEAMFNAGKLTAKNIIKEFFSEIPEKGDYDYKTLNNYFDGIDDQLALDEDEGGKYTDVSGSVVLAMQNSGCTFEETVQMLRQGQMPPVPKFLSTGSMRLKDFDGTVNGGREKMLGDLNRPRNVNYTKTKEPVIADENCHFTVKIGGETIRCDNGEDANSNEHVADKIENMCGKVHVAQATNVMLGLAQGAHTKLLPVLAQHGISSGTGAEHMPLVYTLSKNEIPARSRSTTPNRRDSRSSSTGRPRSTSTAIRLPPRSRSKMRSCDHSLLRV